MTVLCDSCWETVGHGWDITLPDLAYRTLNTRRDKRWDSTWVKDWRDTTYRLVRQAKVPQLRAGAVVWLEFYPGDNRRRDRVNLALVHKAVVDGIVDAGALTDDSHLQVDERMPRIVPGKGTRRWVLHIVGTPA